MAAKPQPRVLDTVENGSKNARRRFVRITAKEVSMVDQGANGHEFLVVKSAGTPEGTVTKAEKDAQILKAAGGTPPVVDPKAVPTDPPATLSVVKAATFLKSIEASVATAATMGGDVAVLKMVAPEQFAMFAAMAEAIDWVTGVMKLVADDLVTFITSNGTTGFMGEPVVKEATVQKRLEDLNDEFLVRVTKAATVVIEKAGKKMAGARMAKMKEVLKTLTDLVTEMDNQPVTKEVVVETKPAEQPPGAPLAAAPANPPVAVSDPVDAAIQKAVAAQAGAMATTVEAAVAKAVEPLTTRLAKLEGAPAKPAAVAADGTEGDGSKEVVTNKSKSGKAFWAGVL